MDKRIFDLIKLSLWGTGVASVDQDIYVEMKQHAIASLPASCLSSLDLPKEMEREWKALILQQVSYNLQNSYEQSKF